MYVEPTDEIKGMIAREFSGQCYYDAHNVAHYNKVRPELDKMRFIAADVGDSPGGMGPALFILAEYNDMLFFFCEEHCSCFGFDLINLDDYLVSREAFAKFKYEERYKKVFGLRYDYSIDEEFLSANEEFRTMASTLARVDMYLRGA